MAGLFVGVWTSGMSRRSGTSGASEKNGATWSSPSRYGLRKNDDGSPGAQTERRGGAGPVRGLLGGKDPTGRFLLWSVIPIRIEHFAIRGRHGGPPSFAAHTRGQRADAA